MARDHVARYLVRQYTLLLSAHVEKICWYLCRDYNEFQTMGLLRDPKTRWANTCLPRLMRRTPT